MLTLTQPISNQNKISRIDFGRMPGDHTRLTKFRLSTGVETQIDGGGGGK